MKGSSMANKKVISVRLDNNNPLHGFQFGKKLTKKNQQPNMMVER